MLNDETAGTGFLVTDRLVATCAHVLEGKGCGDEVELRFRVSHLEDEVVRWGRIETLRPPDGEDVAFLELVEQPPQGAEPLPLGSSSRSLGRVFHTFGFPTLKDVDGMAGELKIIGTTREGGFVVLQARSDELSYGYSGAPVWDDAHRVVGMAVSFVRPGDDPGGKQTTTGFVRPAELLVAIRPELATVAPPPHDVIRRLLVTQDPSIVFVGEYERLGGRYTEPWSVFERVDLKRFAGREWLLQEIDDFLEREDRGYFVLEANAGLGKSTLLAHLVEERGYFHVFGEQARGPEGVLPAHQSLEAQLVRAFELAREASDDLFAAGASRPDFLASLLARVARHRDETFPGEKVVVVVDALDEAGIPPGQNVLGLPEVLPEGVYLIVSQRPVSVPLTVRDVPRLVRELDPESAQNLADIRTYLEAAATWPGIAAALDESRYAVDEFVEVLLAKSGGVWIYLRHVVLEIEKGERLPLDLDLLPDGLWQYYAQFWQRWRQGRDEWERIDLPLLTTLAALREDAPLGLLASLAGLEPEPSTKLRRLLEEEWRPFVVVDEDEEPRYRLYHASLGEFLDGRVDLGTLTTAERSFARELTEATHEVDARICERYLAAWGGIEAGLPELQDPERRDLDGRYGLRTLVEHLERAGRREEVHHLLRGEWMDPDSERSQNAWYRAHAAVADLAAYASDLTRAWRLADEAAHGEIERDEPASGTGLQLRYALLSAAVRSVGESIPPGLIAALVDAGTWTPEQVVIQARQFLLPAQHDDLFAEVAAALEDPVKALRLTREIHTSDVRLRLLVALVPHLPILVRGEVAVEAMDSVTTLPTGREYVLAALAPHLPASAMEHALEVARTVDGDDPSAEAIALEALAPKAPAALLHEAVMTTTTLRRLPALRMRVLGPVAGQLDEQTRAALVAEAFAAPLDALDPDSVTQLARFFTRPQVERAIAELEGSGESIAAVAQGVPEGLLGKLLDAAGRATEGRSDLLAALIPRLPPDLLPRATDLVRALAEPARRAELLVALAPRLAQPKRAEVIREAVGAAIMTPDELERLRVLQLVRPLLPPGSADERTAIDEALQQAAVGLLEHESRLKADELLAALPLLPAEKIGRALELARQALRPDRPAALLAVGPRLDKLDQALVAREVIRAVERLRTLYDPGRWTRLAAESARALATWSPLHALDLLDRLEYADAAPLVPEVAEHLAAHDPSAPELRELEDDLLRVTVLAAVAARLAEPRRTDAFREALLEVRALADAPVRADAIAAVAPFLPKELLHEALAALWGSIDAGILVDALTELSGHLPASQQTRVLASALGTAVATEDDTVASRSLLQLAPLLPDELFGPALDRISAIEYEPARAEAIAALAPLLPDGLVEAARAHARALREDSARVKALMALARRMSDPVEPAADVLETMSDFVRAAEVWRAFDEPDASARARALAELLPGFPDLRPDLLREALDAARTIYDPLDRTETIEAIAAALPDPRTRSLVLQDALAAAFRLGDGEDRTRIVERLASSLQPADVLAIARRIVDPHARARALLDIAPRLGEERAVARAEALTAARRISDEPRRAPMLARVAAHLSHDERDEARREAVRLAVFSRASDRPWMLVDVAPHLPEPRRTRMLDLALRTRPHVLDRSSRAELYARAAAEFRQPKRRESAAATAVAAALGITDDARRAQTLRRLVQRLTRVPEVGLAVRAAMNIRADSLKRDFVVEVAAQLPESALADALVVVESIDHERERAAALVAVARRLPEPLLRDALDLTGTIRLPEARADVLVELAQRLPASWLPWALALAATTEYPAARARSLAALAPRVTEAALEEKALSAARGIDVPRWRAHALVAVAEQLPALQKVEALVEAVAAAPRSDPVREQALVQLGSLLPSLDRAHALTAWSELVRALALQPPADVLADVRPLAPVLAELGGERAVVEAATAIENVARWLP